MRHRETIPNREASATVSLNEEYLSSLSDKTADVVSRLWGLLWPVETVLRASPRRRRKAIEGLALSFDLLCERKAPPITAEEAHRIAWLLFSELPPSENVRHAQAGVPRR